MRLLQEERTHIKTLHGYGKNKALKTKSEMSTSMSMKGYAFSVYLLSPFLSSETPSSVQ